MIGVFKVRQGRLFRGTKKDLKITLTTFKVSGINIGLFFFHAIGLHASEIKTSIWVFFKRRHL